MGGLDRRHCCLRQNNNGLEREKTQEERTEQNTDVFWWPCMWQCSDVIWGSARSRAWTGYCWCDAIWCQEGARGWDVWTKGGPFYAHPCSLSLFLTHVLAQCVNFIAVFTLSISHAATPSLFNSFLSSPLALIFFLTLPPKWAVSLSRSTEQWAWVQFPTSLQLIDKNTDLVAAAAGWWEGGRDMKI